MNYNELSLFQACDEAECKQILSRCNAKEKRYAKGEMICRYEGRQEKIGIIKNGAAQILRYDEANRRMVLEWLQPGDVFGEVLSFPCGYEKEEETFVICASKTTVIYLEYAQLLAVCAEAKDGGLPGKISSNWNTVLTGKMQQFGRRLEVLSCRSIREKLSCYFSILAKEQGGKNIQLPYNMTVLADYLCVDRSAMVREIGQMREEGRLKMGKRDVLLL